MKSQNSQKGRSQLRENPKESVSQRKELNKMEKTMTLIFTEAEANLLLKALGEIPAKDSMQLIGKIISEGSKQLYDLEKIQESSDK